MRLKYVGAKGSEAKFVEKTGIVWTPGASHDVAEGMAAHMLKHPDVWAPDDLPAQAPAPPAVTEGQDDGKNVLIKADGAQVVLDDMDAKGLRSLCKELGVTVHFALGKARLIETLMAAGA